MPANPMPRPRAIETVGRTVGRRLRPRVDKAFIEIDRAWHLVNGYGQVCGRLASKIVPLLCGKHKPTYQPQRDMGDFVVVLNVSKTVHTGNALDQKKYFRNSGFPGGVRAMTLRQLITKNPLEPLRRAIYGMLPKNKLRDQRMRRLRLFPDETHVHEANFQPGQSAFHVKFDQQDSPAVLTPVRPKETP